ncbi:alanine racemase [Sphingomonas sp. BGYR3]|uniref:alanine racemase n=1 Tax=Sphingomonas sp. BGYR3 TaxID=2975483 RepID=UPI0021A3C9A8|nr:alanine racemase [Sphingomonas sp. BGYR3]MDG5489504.1 alanine racemase [Sphingomonas sp. BGYR3]
MTIEPPPPPLRLILDSDALAANWRALAARHPAAACGAAVKADGYGLGAREVVRRLTAAGCRDFFVATWAEALAIADLAPSVAVLHGVRSADMAVAAAAPAHLRPVLNSAEQVARWRQGGGGRPCDLMVDTGMNRLGVAAGDAAALAEGLALDTLMSHLACADEVHPLNQRQLDAMTGLRSAVAARRYSLANSAGIFLGPDYGFDLTRPGLSLYGGIPGEQAAAVIRPVARLEAEVLQIRRIGAGESVGYNATFTAPAPMRLATLNIGYADGYGRGFSGVGAAVGPDGRRLAVLGRVSMDLLIVDVTDAGDVGEGDWLAVEYDLVSAAAASGRSQYELLTGLGQRMARHWR